MTSARCAGGTHLVWATDQRRQGSRLTNAISKRLRTCSSTTYRCRRSSSGSGCKRLTDHEGNLLGSAGGVRPQAVYLHPLGRRLCRHPRGFQSAVEDTHQKIQRALHIRSHATHTAHNNQQRWRRTALAHCDWGALAAAACVKWTCRLQACRWAGSGSVKVWRTHCTGRRRGRSRGRRLACKMKSVNECCMIKQLKSVNHS